MLNIFRYGPNKTIVKLMVRLSWPIIAAGKKFSAQPVLKWLINPFFKRPYNEIISIPINLEVKKPDSVPVPGRVLERLVSEVDDVFIHNECHCRRLTDCENYPRTIGCMTLGPAIKRIHPSHGYKAGREQAVAHVRRAAEAGLIANIAHVWIDPLAFGLTNFKQVMFICFCDDCCCIYRTHMKRRGANLDRAYRKLPGISVKIDEERCNGCGICVDRCFVAAIEIRNEIAAIGDDCKGCGRCVEVCPRDAVSISLDNEDELLRQLKIKINEVADLTFKN